MRKEEASLRAAKQEVRKRILFARDLLSEEYRLECANALLDHLDVFGEVEGKTISGFLPIQSEMDARPLMTALKAKGARLCLPVVIDKTTLEFRAYENDSSLVDAGFGTKGPPKGSQVVQPDIMIVPLAAFDPHGGRIGYGAGHYDRAIAKLRAHGASPRIVGLGFAMQEVPHVPQDENDIALDAILTHEGVIRPD